MSSYVLPIFFALIVWWFGTGLVLFLDSLPRNTYRWSMFGATVLLCLATLGVLQSSGDATVRAAYLAFACGVMVWAWLEMAYFTGLVTGPRKSICPPGTNGWRRFMLAVQTSLYHELAVILTAGMLYVATYNEPNQVATWTFIVLWLMRWSAKLNLFLGVPNLNENWLPEHLRFLTTYIPKRPMNPLFPISVTLATVVVVLLILDVVHRDASEFEVVGVTLVATLLALAILEHWFLVLSLPDEALWRWALNAVATGNEVETRQDERKEGVKIEGRGERLPDHRRSKDALVQTSRVPLKPARTCCSR